MTEADPVAEQAFEAWWKSTMMARTEPNRKWYAGQAWFAAFRAGQQAGLEQAAKICDSLVVECDKRSSIGNIKSAAFRSAAKQEWVGFSIGAEEASVRIRRATTPGGG